MTKDIKKQIDELRKKITRHNELYYVKALPEISDGAYDKLMRELKELEDKYPEYASGDSPTRTVGASVPDKFTKVRHVSSMLSLESVNDEDGCERFGKACEKEVGFSTDFMCEPKLDGISIELVYENGEFIRGSTRGDGVIGEDVTLNLKTISSVPQKLKGKNVPERIAVRGEVMMHIRDFQELNKRQVEEGKDVFANPRNVAAGSMRQLDRRITALRKLRVYCYRILDISGEMPQTQKEALELLRDMGLVTVPGTKHCGNIGEAITYHHRLEERRDGLDYEIDGVVLKVNSLEFQKKLGMRTNNPRWAVAYKFKARREITRVEDIVVQVGRTGVLTPLALLQPVEVGGVTVSRATLHNMDQINRLGLKIGDHVKVERAGDVIPYITEVVKDKRTGKEKTFCMPKKCPSCDNDVEAEDVFCRCPAGLACPAQLKELMSHYASKGAVDIDGFSDKTVELLYEKGLIRRLSDIYRLRREDLIGLEGWKEKKTNNLIRSIENSKDVFLDRFIFGLGIKNVGKHIASLLAKRFGTLEKITAASEEDLISMNEIGPEIVDSITGFFRSKKNIEEIGRLRKNGVKVRENKTASGGKFADMKIVLTGSLRSMSRSEAKKRIESEGGEVSSGVSKTTSFVVAGAEPGSKLDVAKKKGVKVLTEDEFLGIIGE